MLEFTVQSSFATRKQVTIAGSILCFHGLETSLVVNPNVANDIKNKDL
jgi:hypothetical protein